MSDCIVYEVRKYENGKESWIVDGKLHREDGPAYINSHGDKFWYRKGRLHREDGPAYVDRIGTGSYYLNGWFYPTKERWEKAVRDLHSEDEDTIENLKKRVEDLEQRIFRLENPWLGTCTTQGSTTGNPYFPSWNQYPLKNWYNWNL